MDNLKIIVSVYAVALVATFTVAFVVFNKPDETVTKVISGELTLMCELEEKGVTQIDPEKITGREDGYWLFVNGKAKSCYVD